jgi:hypothetical protein
MRKDRKSLAWLAVAITMAACGGSEPPPQSPKSAPPTDGKTHAVTESTASQAPSRSGYEESAPNAPPPPAAAPAPVAPSAVSSEPSREAPSATDPQARYYRASAQLTEARRQFDIAAGQRDCANACRALDSMERAAGQICEVARSTEERRTCRDAQDQVSSARERVRNACGGCQKRP